MSKYKDDNDSYDDEFLEDSQQPAPSPYVRRHEEKKVGSVEDKLKQLKTI